MDAFETDLDSECVWFDNAWLTREDLKRKITGMLEAGDYQVARPSQALELLTRALASARLLALRITPEMSDALNHASQQTGRPMGALAREAITSFLANVASIAPAAQNEGAPPPAPEEAQGAAVSASPAVPPPLPLPLTQAAAVTPDGQVATNHGEVEKQWFGGK